MFYHNPDSWKELWKETIGRLEGAEFVEAHVKVDAHIVVSRTSPARGMPLGPSLSYI